MAQRPYNPSDRAFDWCYTFNDVPQDEATVRDQWIPHLHADLDAAIDAGHCKYYAFQLERGRKTGHLHVHCFVQFAERNRATRLAGVLAASNPFRPCKPNILHRLGSPEDCDRYHRKEKTRIDGPYKGGKLTPDRTGHGRRTELDFVAQRIRDGAGARAIAFEFTGTWIRYSRGIVSAIDVLNEPKELDADPGM